MSSRINLVVEYEDGSTQELDADQRDMIAYEAVTKRGFMQGLGSQTVTATRHLAFIALQRRDLLPDARATHEQWEETVPSVRFDLIDVDPTKAAAPAARPSSSPSKPASVSRRSARSGSPKTS